MALDRHGDTGSRRMPMFLGRHDAEPRLAGKPRACAPALIGSCAWSRRRKRQLSRCPSEARAPLPDVRLGLDLLAVSCERTPQPLQVFCRHHPPIVGACCLLCRSKMLHTISVSVSQRHANVVGNAERGVEVNVAESDRRSLRCSGRGWRGVLDAGTRTHE